KRKALCNPCLAPKHRHDDLHGQECQFSALIYRPSHNECRPVVRMAVPGIAPSEFLLGYGQRLGAAFGEQKPIKSDHQVSSRFVIPGPQTCQDIPPAGAQESSCKSDKLIAPRSLREIAFA